MNRKFKVDIPKSAKKSLKKIPLPWRERITRAIDDLENNPFYGEKMWGKLSGRRKIIIWPYRIIYTVDEKARQVKVLNIGHRGHRSTIGYK